MTPDEAQAELENILIECSDVVSQAWVLDKLLARPELVLAALGVGSEWEQRAEMFEHQSRQWQERYAKCSDLLSDAEEDAETAEAEVERLNEVVAGMDRELAEWQSRAIAAEAERDRLREALERIAEMQPETHPGWNDEYIKASWVFDAARAALGVLLGTPTMRTPLGDVTERIQLWELAEALCEEPNP